MVFKENAAPAMSKPYSFSEFLCLHLAPIKWEFLLGEGKKLGSAPYQIELALFMIFVG